MKSEEVIRKESRSSNLSQSGKPPTVDEAEVFIRNGERSLREAEIRRRDKIRPLLSESARRRFTI